MQILNWIWILSSLVYVALCIAADYLLYRRRKRKGKGWADALPSFSIPAVIVGIEFAVFSASESITKEMLSYQMLKWLLINVCISLCGIVVNLILTHSKLRETFWSWLSLNVGATLCTGLFSLAVYLIF